MKSRSSPLFLIPILCAGFTGCGGGNNYGGYGGSEGYPGYGNYGGGGGPYGYGNYGGYGNSGPNDYARAAEQQEHEEQKEARARQELNDIYKNKAEITKLPPQEQKQIVKRAKKLFGELD